MNDQYQARRRYSTTLIIIGFIILLYPFSTEALGAYSQYSLKNEWEKEALNQEKESRLSENRQQASLGSDAISNENAVLGKVSETGNKLSTERAFPATKIKIPKINLEQVIVEGVGTEELKKGPGHYPGTSYPGEKGNVGIAGHRVTYTRPFFNVDELEPGDEIILETLNYIYTYKVEFKTVLDPSDVSMLTPAEEAMLTLTTCTPKFSARSRLDIRANLVKSEPRRKPSLIRQLVSKVTPKKKEVLPKNLIESTILEAQEALKNDPNNMSAHLQLGIAYQAQKKFDEAEAEFILANEADTGSSLPHYRLGLLFEQLEDNERAIESFTKAISLNPADDNAMFRLGNLYLKLEENDKAIDLFEKGLQMEPFSADYHYNLAIAYEISGNLDEASKHYQEAIRFVPDFDEAKARLKRILK